jgi:hypothetical protein
LNLSGGKVLGKLGFPKLLERFTKAIVFNRSTVRLKSFLGPRV